MSVSPLPVFLQRFFTERLTTQLRASPHTIASYRDTFRLLLRFASDELKRPPTELLIQDLTVELISRFLVHIEQVRGNSVRSRNVRLAAIRSFFKDVAVNEPPLLEHCQRVLAMPSKRYERRTVDFLSQAEIEALIQAPDVSRWIGRRDRALLMLVLQTGLRVSEVIALKTNDVMFGTGAHVRCVGKGRKQRCTPLRKDVIHELKQFRQDLDSTKNVPLFATTQGRALSRDAVERLVRKYTAIAAQSCPSLQLKKVTPHVLRHTAAMQLLHGGVDTSVIALWLGHESVETTQIYIHADMRLKEQALARTRSVQVKPGRYQPDDELLAFLESL